MKYLKIFMCIAIIFCIAINYSSLFAAAALTEGGTSASGFLDSIFNSGKNFTSGANNTILGNGIAEFIKVDLKFIIETIGNFIFFVVAAFLGVKYIWSGLEGKTQVKETLPTFVVSACAFYLADSIYNLATGIITDSTSGTGYNDVIGNLWGNVSVVVNILAIAGIVALGLKYMLASANTKADIKKDLIPVAIGLTLVYAVNSILTFIVKAGGEIL